MTGAHSEFLTIVILWNHDLVTIHNYQLLFLLTRLLLDNQFLYLKTPLTFYNKTVAEKTTAGRKAGINLMTLKYYSLFTRFCYFAIKTKAAMQMSNPHGCLIFNWWPRRDSNPRPFGS